MKKVALIGYSGHALVVADTFIHLGYEIVGYFEKNILKTNPLQLTYLGFEQDSDFLVKVKDIYIFPSIGDNYVRREITNMLIKYNLKLATAIHPKANVSNLSVIDEGTLVCQGTCINSFARIGKGVIINTSAIIEHGCDIDDFVHIAPGAVLTGNVTIGENTFIGANAVIKQCINIGKNAVIGAGSVILNDVLDNETWVGNPARKLNNNNLH